MLIRIWIHFSSLRKWFKMIRRYNFKRENLEKKRNEKFLVHTVGSTNPEQGSAPGIVISWIETRCTVLRTYFHSKTLAVPYTRIYTCVLHTCAVLYNIVRRKFVVNFTKILGSDYGPRIICWEIIILRIGVPHFCPPRFVALFNDIFFT